MFPHSDMYSLFHSISFKKSIISVTFNIRNYNPLTPNFFNIKLLIDSYNPFICSILYKFNKLLCDKYYSRQYFNERTYVGLEHTICLECTMLRRFYASLNY